MLWEEVESRLQEIQRYLEITPMDWKETDFLTQELSNAELPDEKFEPVAHEKPLGQVDLDRYRLHQLLAELKRSVRWRDRSATASVISEALMVIAILKRRPK